MFSFAKESLNKELDSFGEERDIKPNLEKLGLLIAQNHLPEANGEESQEGNDEMSSKAYGALSSGYSTPIQIVNIQSVLNQNDGNLLNILL